MPSAFKFHDRIRMAPGDLATIKLAPSWSMMESLFPLFIFARQALLPWPDETCSLKCLQSRHRHLFNRSIHPAARPGMQPNTIPSVRELQAHKCCVEPHVTQIHFVKGANLNEEPRSRSSIVTATRYVRGRRSFAEYLTLANLSITRNHDLWYNPLSTAIPSQGSIKSTFIDDIPIGL